MANTVRVTLQDSEYETLSELGEFYQTGPETLAGKLLAGILIPFGAARARTGEVRYTLTGPEPVKYLHRVSWLCHGQAEVEEIDYDRSCSPETTCNHQTSWSAIDHGVYRCNDCGTYFDRPFVGSSVWQRHALPYSEQKEVGSN